MIYGTGIVKSLAFVHRLVFEIKLKQDLSGTGSFPV